MESVRVAVVTGGASGIGRAVVEQLAQNGCDVAIFDVNSAGAQEVADTAIKLGRRALALTVDVADTAEVEAAVAKVRHTLGPVQVLVHSAGICTLTPLSELSDVVFDRTLAIHLRGAFVCARAVAPDMIAANWGRIVNITSVAGLNGGGSGLAHYAAAKGGIVGLTKALAHELAANGVTVNAIAPGLVDTPMVRGSGMPDSMLEYLAQRTPVRRVGQPADIAAACLYLVSPAASFVTGQVLSPNGGAYM